jgi:hypothetical protein
MRRCRTASFPRLAVGSEGPTKRREKHSSNFGVGRGCVGVDVKLTLISFPFGLADLYDFYNEILAHVWRSGANVTSFDDCKEYSSGFIHITTTAPETAYCSESAQSHLNSLIVTSFFL